MVQIHAIYLSHCISGDSTPSGLWMQYAESFPAFSTLVSDATRIFPTVILIKLAGHVIAGPALILLQHILGIKLVLNLWKVSYLYTNLARSMASSQPYGLGLS